MSEPTPAQQKPFWQRLARVLVFGRRPGWTLVRIVLLVLAAVVVFTFVLLPVRIEGASMFPRCKEGEVHCVNRLAYWRRAPARFEIVALRPVKDGPYLLKRIIGLPGEEVAIRQGVVHVNGRPLEEPHVRGLSKWEERPVRLETDQYLVIGDNRAIERALHSHGVTERWMIVGRLWF
jgi:signal peptidase I